VTSKESKGGQARMSALNPKQRQALARKAAKARWENKSVPKKSSKPAQRRQARAPRNTFGEALYEAQRQLAEATSQLAYHQSEYSRLRIQIPHLQRTVAALQGLGQDHVGQPQGPVIGYYPQGYAPPQGAPLPPNYSFDTVLSDAPLNDPPMMVQYQPEPSMTFVMPPAPPPVPPAHPPVPSMVELPKPPKPPRGGGMAGNPSLVASEVENENQFLDEADNDPNNPAGRSWK
jgi:hypothetical protein